MSQEGILEFLKKHPNKWFSTKDIDFHLKMGCGTSLRKLRIHGDVSHKIKNIKGGPPVYLYKCKGGEKRN